MAERCSESSTSKSSSCSPRPKLEEDKAVLHLLSTGDVIKYTIPSFSVITVNLQHVVGAMDEYNNQTYDVFLKHCPEIELRIPCSVIILDSCHLQASEFCKTIGNRYNRFSPEGVLVVWKWELFDYMHHDEEHISNEEEICDNSEDESTADPAATSHVITFKCIGTTKAQEYQDALVTARDMMQCGHSVPITLVHEPNNPRDSRALAFVCQIEGKSHRIGYVVSDVLDEVHSAINSGSILSIKIAWVRYITDWRRSGPGFFAGVNIEKTGTWSGNVVRYSSTR